MNPFVHKTETRLFLNLQLLARVLTECKHGLKKTSRESFGSYTGFLPVLLYRVVLLCYLVILVVPRATNENECR